MAYVPPHKRLSQTQGVPPPNAELLVPHFKKNVNIHSSSLGKKIIYADHSISKSLAVSLTYDGLIPSSVHLVPVSLESAEWKTGLKPLTLVGDQQEKEKNSGDQKSPWVSVAENIHSDLLSAFDNVRRQMTDDNLEEIKPTIVAWLGKVLFKRSSSLSVDSLKENSFTEASLRKLKRTFCTNLPSSYIEHIQSGIVPQIGANFEEEKELYHVKLADAVRPDSTISCKCRVQKGENKLELYKTEWNQVRNLVVDISCLDSTVDLRLALCTKRIIKVLTDEEKQSIGALINSAILDHDVKGGLKWPLGKANSGSRYSVVGVWLRLREADRYDFLTSAGEVTKEVVLKLRGVTKNLLEQKSEAVAVSTLLEDTLKLIWDYFLSWDGSVIDTCKY